MSNSTIHLTVDSGPKQGETLDRKPGSLIRVGRVVKGNTLVIKDSLISPKHLAIEFDHQACRWVLRDLDTSNGTFVNGDRVPPSAAVGLSDGDTVKIGECTSISVKISVFEENVDGVGRGKRRSGRSRKVGDGCGEVGVRYCERVSAKDEILDSVVEERAEDVPENLKKGRKLSSSGDLSKDEILGSALDCGTEAKNLGKGRRTRSTRIEVLGSKADDVKEIKNQKCESLSMKGGTLDSVAEGGAKEVPKNLGRGRKRNSTRCLKKDEILEAAPEVRIVARENVERDDERNSFGVSKKDESSDKVVEDRLKVPENLGRGRRGKAATVSKTDEIVEDNVDVPKKLRRGRRTKSSQNVEKDSPLDLIAEDRTEQPESLGEQRGKFSASVLMENGNSEPVVEDFIEVPKKLMRGRSTNSVPVAKNDGALGDGTEVPKTMGGRRRTRSTKVSEKDDSLDLAAEDRIQAPKNAGRGRRISSARLSKLDENLDSVVEDTTEMPKKLGRGKRGANSSKVSKFDEILDVVVEDEVVVMKNVSKGKLKKALAHRTRASSRVLKPAQNLYQSKELGDGSRQLSQSDTIKQIPIVSSSPADSKDKSRSREDKENYASVKIQKTHCETTKMGNSYCEGIPDEERPVSASIATQNQEPLQVAPKVWNGNGIPNTTTKYMEDQKVSWHATPFEERLEKALSDDKLFPQRKLTS